MGKTKSFGIRKTPDVFRLSFTYDKLGNKSGVIYFYKVEFKQRELIKNLLKSFDLSETDIKMLQTTLRTGDYSENDRSRLQELRKMYIEDNL